jgi:uncharacterized membrane protein (DUF106 family)
LIDEILILVIKLCGVAFLVGATGIFTGLVISLIKGLLLLIDEMRRMR